MSALTYLHNDVAAVMRSQSTDKKDTETREVIYQIRAEMIEKYKLRHYFHIIPVPAACHATISTS